MVKSGILRALKVKSLFCKSEEELFTDGGKLYLCLMLDRLEVRKLNSLNSVLLLFICGLLSWSKNLYFGIGFALNLLAVN